MTAALRVPRRPPIASAAWQQLVGVLQGGAWAGMGSSAAYYNGKTYIGYIDQNSNIRVASYDHASHAVTVSPSIASGLANPNGQTVDLHTAPGVLVRSSDHKILIAYTAQATNHMYVALSTNAEDVSAWGAPTDIASTLAGGGQYTYGNLSQLSGESGKIWLHYRDGIDSNGKLCYSTSTDGGSTWTGQTVLYETSASPTTGAYWNLDTDDASRIDFLVSDGNAPSGDTASIYHFYYSGGSYYKTDGTLIGGSGSLPLLPANLTKISDGATNGSIRLPYAIKGGANPYACWAAANTAGWATNPENYWYAVFSGGAWSAHQITDCGVIPNTDLFEGGIAIDRTDPTKVYLARSISGNYQLFLYQTADGGSTWTSTQLTSDTGDTQNYHPVSPHDASSGLRCAWSGGTIAPDTCPVNFSCQIRGYPNPISAF